MQLAKTVQKKLWTASYICKEEGRFFTLHWFKLAHIGIHASSLPKDKKFLEEIDFR